MIVTAQNSTVSKKVEEQIKRVENNLAIGVKLKGKKHIIFKTEWPL